MKKISALEGALRIGDLVKYTYPAGEAPAEGSSYSIGFVLGIIENHNEKQMNMFPMTVIYDTHLCARTQTYSYNLEFISRGP